MGSSLRELVWRVQRFFTFGEHCLLPTAYCLLFFPSPSLLHHDRRMRG
jgi:hypothetical protein